MTKRIENVTFLVGYIGGDVEDIAPAFHQLVEELHEVECVRSIEEVKTAIRDDGAMGGDIHEILVKIAEIGGLTALFQAIGGWLKKDKRRSIRITIHGSTIELNNISASDQEKWTEWFKTQVGISF